MDIPCDLSVIPDYIWGIITLAQEARSEPFDGLVAVAEVIRNRMELKFYSDGTVRDTVLRAYQFSGWNQSDPNRIICAGLTWDSKTIQDALRAWKIAFFNKSELTAGAVNYHGDYITPEWSRSPEFIRTTKIGVHIFYRRRM